MKRFGLIILISIGLASLVLAQQPAPEPAQFHHYYLNVPEPAAAIARGRSCGVLLSQSRVCRRAASEGRRERCAAPAEKRDRGRTRRTARRSRRRQRDWCERLLVSDGPEGPLIETRQVPHLRHG